MNLFSTIILGLCGFVLTSSAAEFEKDEGVYVLTDKNYDDAVKEFEYVLVEFYAPWCGHCKALAPDYVKAAQMLKEKDSPIKLAKVDGTQEEKLLETHHVTGYPTIKFYRNGEPIKYNGGRMAAEIVDWVEKKIGPPALELKDEDAVKTFIDEHEVVVIGFFKNPESEVAKKYLDAVRDYEGYPVAITSVEKAFETQSAKDETVILFKKFDEGRAVYEGAIGQEALLEFIERYALPVVVEFNHDTAQKIFKGLVKAHLLLFISKTAEDYPEKYEMFKELAVEFKHKVMFVTVDTDEDDHRRVTDFLGLKDDKFPTMRIIQMEDDILKYKPENTEISSDNIKSFVQNYIDGKVPQHYKSEPLPEDWNSKPVKYLTSSNFDEIVFDKSKNVLVEFYAPWCGHCKQLSPIWDELAESLSDKDDVVVTKIDATANELPHTKVRSFPTIKLYKKDSNDAVEYNGERTKEGLTKFLTTDGVYGQAAPDHDEL